MSDSRDPTATARDTPDPPAGEETVAAPASAADYVGLTPHARGGLGEVFRATDPALHRTVAVKRLRDERADDPGSRRRFLVEAEVTARLEHPGVVPVYRLFAGGDGRPAYAMRFVEGRTLADAIREYHAGPPDPVAFRRLLQSFLQVCQTVAYAHSRGVIHRDLKPNNVMLGKFGETLVVDWGLAKVVGRPEAARASGAGEETLVPAGGDSGGSETQMGSAVGTPSFMSPEQAAGRWNVVDQRSDVYALGAVLYTVLTGQPPIRGGDWPEQQQRIQRGDFPAPHAVKADVPRALEAVCRRAMPLRPEDRYPSAEALAADVEHWLADEPVSAWREPPAARARRWAKRNRTLVSAAVALLVAAVVGLSVGAALLQRARADTERQWQAAVAARGKAEALNRFLIDDLLKQADPVNNPVGDKITVRGLLDKAAARLDGQTHLAEQPEVEAELRAVIGHAYEYLGLSADAERQYRRAWELRSRLLGPDHPDALALRNRLAWAVGDQGRLAEFEELARDTLAACDRALGDGSAVTADAADNLGEVRHHQGRSDEAVALRRRASRISHAVRGPDGEDTLVIDNNLAVDLIMAGRPSEAEPVFRSVIERRRRLNPRHPELAQALSNMAGIFVLRGEPGEAERLLREAIALSTEVRSADHPGTLGARSLLGYALEAQGRWAEAEREDVALLADRRRVRGPTHYETQRTLAYLARVYAKQGKWPDAVRPLADLMTAQKPDPGRTPEALAPALVAALSGRADPAAAEPLLRECAEAVKGRTLPGDWLAAELASRYGDCLRRQKKYAEAEPLLTAAAADAGKAVGAPPEAVAAARERVAKLYDDWNKPAEAAKWRKADGR